MFKARHQRNILLHCVVRKEPRFLNGVTNVAAKLDHVPLGGGAPINQDLALDMVQKAVDQPKRCGLAGAATPEKHERFSMADGEGEIRDKSAITRNTVGDVDKLDGCGGIGHRLVGMIVAACKSKTYHEARRRREGAEFRTARE